MHHHTKSFLLALGTISLLSFLLLLFPWSLFSQDSKPPSPDFNGNGVVDIPDFLFFVNAFGSKEGQERYDAKYDLNGDGEIGIPDFLAFVDSFGKEVNRVPVFASTPPVTRSVDENTASGQAIGEPLSATDADGNTLTYRLSGADADSFAIDASTGQIQTKGTYDFEQKNSYSVIVIVSDGEGGRSSLVVTIAITDIDELTATVPSNVMIEEDDSKLIVRWDAVPNEEGKPPVIGYEVGYRERPDPFDAPQENSNKWKGIQRVSSQLDSLIITGLLNGQAYLVSVRTLVDGGMSAWSSPVLGIPVIPAAGPVFPGGGGGGGGGSSGGSGGGGSSGVGDRTPPPTPGPNQAPTFNDGASTSRSVAENTAPNQNIQHPTSATDADRNSLTYRLSGTDANSFNIIASNGQLRTRSGITYNYEDKNRYEVTVEADDNRGGTATIDVTIYVADVNEPPQAPARPRVDPASSTSLTVSWTEPTNTGPDIDDYDIQYRTGSDSFTAWPHTGPGTSTTITDLEVNTRYEVQVKAHNDEGESLWSSSGFGTTSANQPPVFDETSPTRSLAENTTGTQNIGNPISANDPEGTEVSYRLAGGDTGQFTIDTNNGQLRTQTGVDYNYEVKNRYSVTVEAADDQGGRATITVTIDITDDDNERPERPDKPAVTASTLNSLSIRWTAPTNTGPNINDYDVQYREGTSGNFTAWPHTSTGTSTTITGLKANTLYQVQVLARSDEGESLWSPSADVRTVANQAPTFNEGTRTTRSFAENTTGTQDIGNPITATDRDGGTPTYRLEGTDQASFVLNNNQLQTLSGETYDYEEKNRYEVTVRVEDGQGGSNTIEVTINLTDVREPPETPDPPSVSAASSISLTVTWDEPTNTGPDINDYDVQYREGDSGNFTAWSHNSADRTATITGRTPGTSYQVQVRARNAEGTSDWSESGTGSTSANQRPIFTDGSSATRSFAENTTGTQDIGDPVGATDPENTPLTYSLEGTDKDAFTLISNSGQLRTKSGQTYDYETQSRYSVDVKASDEHSSERTISVFIDLTDVNEVPTFTSDATFEAAENNPFAGRVDAEDVDSADGITGYTITGGAGRDPGQLEINSAGVLTFKDAPDFENPTDVNNNNTYIVEVTATGGSGGRALTAQQTITVTVTDENELPHFTSDDAFMVTENNQSVGRVVAQDVDQDDSITGYDVTGGTDQNEFEITNTNQLHFKDDPNFEDPTDSGSYNEYIVEVTATGGTGTRERTITQEITVTVEDDDEPPGKPDQPTVSNETENSLTVTWDEPTNTGPDITKYYVQYSISGTFTDWPDTGPSRSRTITGLRSGSTYQIQVRAENDEGKGAWSNPGSGTTLTAPTVSSVAFTSTPASAQNNTYKLNDIIDVTATFSEAVTVTGTPQIDLTIGSTVRQANYQSGSTTTQLVFQYTVQADDEDTDGASINANGLKLNGGGIRRHGSTSSADLTHAALTNQSGHKVDGIAPALTKARVNGDALALTYGKTLDSDPLSAPSDFAVTVDSEARSVSAVAVNASTVTLTLASAVTRSQTVILAYTPAVNPIRDLAQNPATALTDQEVTNRTILNLCDRTPALRGYITHQYFLHLLKLSIDQGTPRPDDVTCSDVPESFLSSEKMHSVFLSGTEITTLKEDDLTGLTRMTSLFISNNPISSLPEGIFADQTRLENIAMNSAHFSTLPEDFFSGLPNLRRIDMHSNRLSTLPENIFSGLSNLITLLLHNNRFSTLPANIFSDQTALRRLTLRNNQLSSLPANVFSGLTALDSLHLQHNQLGDLPANIFSDQTALRRLYLNNNQLSSLPANVFSNLTELRRFYLNNNQLSSLPANVFSNLTELQRLNLNNNQLGDLPANIFFNLQELQELYLNDNQLAALPDNSFHRLAKLTKLRLDDNTIDPLPIEIALELIASGQFKARAHTGAPFRIAMTHQTVNGTIEGFLRIAIPTGKLSSTTRTATRTPGTTAAVTVDITLPSLPSGHSGYALVKSADLPLTVIDAVPGVNIHPTALTIPQGNSGTYTAVLNSLPTANVTVTVNVPTGSDASVAPSPLTFTTDSWNTSQTVTITTQTDTDEMDDTVILTHSVSGGNYESLSAESVTVTISETDDATNNPPTFTSTNTFDVDENTIEVGTVVATDPNARDHITGYEITGGDHQAQFSITSGGVLSLATAPDFERPAAGTNTYTIVVTATSGTRDREMAATQTITVNVDDVDEPPGEPPAPSISTTGPISSLIVSPGGNPANTGPAITAYDIQYRVGNTGDYTTYNPDPEPDWTTSNWEVTITRLPRNKTYQVRVRARSAEGNSQWSSPAEAMISNASPIAKGIDNVTIAAGGAVEVVSLDDAFSDPDDFVSNLRFSAVSNNTTVATVQVINPSVLVKPLSAGTATITVTVTDPWGATASTTFDANVQTPTLSAPTLSISDNTFTIGFTDDFAANETRAYGFSIRQKAPIGEWATGCRAISNDENSPQSKTVTQQGAVPDFFESGSTYEADYGYIGSNCSGSSLVGVRSAVVEATRDGTPSFDIAFIYVGGSPSLILRTAFQNAADKWEQIITHGIPDRQLSTDTRNWLNQRFSGTTAPATVDDLLIYVESGSIDGSGGIVAISTELLPRRLSALPVVSQVTIDGDELGSSISAQLQAIILHEVGHALGFGVSSWRSHNLLQNPSLDLYRNLIDPVPDTHFNGPLAIAAFNSAGGSSFSGAKVPVENSGGVGVQDVHWRSSVFGNELMTFGVSSSYSLSAITIQSLADMGYTVDVTQADAYTVSSSSFTRDVRASKDIPVPPLNCILRSDLIVPDESEPIILNLKPVNNRR